MQCLMTPYIISHCGSTKLGRCWNVGRAGQREVIKTFLLYQGKLTYHHWHACLDFFTQIEVKTSIFFAVFNAGTDIYFSFNFFFFTYI